MMGFEMKLLNQAAVVISAFFFGGLLFPVWRSIYENVNDKAERGQSNFRLLLPDLSRS